MEEIDRRIVSLLTRNGRMSFTELARQAGLSVSAVHQRVRRLEQDGVIKGYVAVFDPDDVGLPLTAFVSIKPFDAAAPDGTHLGRDRCLRLIAEHSDSPVETIVDELLQATRVFAEGMPLHDDLTIVVAKVK